MILSPAARLLVGLFLGNNCDNRLRGSCQVPCVKKRSPVHALIGIFCWLEVFRLGVRGSGFFSMGRGRDRRIGIFVDEARAALTGQVAPNPL